MYKSPTRRNATVATSYYTWARAFKSPPFVMIAALLRSRSRIKAKAKLAIERSRDLERDKQLLIERSRQFSERLIEAKQHTAILQQQLDEALASVNLPYDPPCRHTWLWSDHDRTDSQPCHVDRLSTGRPSHPNLLRCVWIAERDYIGSRVVC